MAFNKQIVLSYKMCINFQLNPQEIRVYMFMQKTQTHKNKAFIFLLNIT